MSVLKYKDGNAWKVISTIPNNKVGTTDPTTSTSADYTGQIYLNTTSGSTFICTAINEGVYTWRLLTADITAKEDKSNKVTALSASSTDTQYPSAKVTYDSLATKEDAGYLTIGGTKYQIRTSTVDEGAAGYITFVVDPTPVNFKIVGGEFNRTYLFIEGTTWETWVASAYNTDGCWIETTDNNRIYIKIGTYNYVVWDNVLDTGAVKDALIVKDRQYGLMD